MPRAHAITTVAVIRTRPETVLEDHARLLRVAGLDGPVMPEGLLVCLDQEPGAGDLPGAASSPWQLEGVVRALLAAGCRADSLSVHLPVPETRTPRTKRRGPDARPRWRRVATACGLTDPHSSPPAPAGAPRLLCAVLRLDQRLGVPGALGVLAAHLLGPAAIQDLDRRPQVLVDAWRSLSQPAVAGAVIDATVCGDGAGIRDRRPIAAHLLLAGRDPVAVDAVAAAVAGLDPRRLPLLAAAQAAGLGCADPARIAIVGDVAADAAIDPTRGLAAGLPSLGLEAVAAVRVAGSVPGWRWPAWAGSFLGLGPLVLWRARRQRDRHETSPWGSLRRHYDRHDHHGGGTA